MRYHDIVCVCVCLCVCVCVCATLCVYVCVWVCMQPQMSLYKYARVRMCVRLHRTL